MRPVLALLLLAACAPQPEVPRATGLGPKSLASQITPARPEGCAAQAPGGWFVALCPETLTPGFIMTLQRALAARGLYAGAPSGRMDAQTRAAIALWQGERGLESETLSRRGAQQLGLVPWLD